MNREQAEKIRKYIARVEEMNLTEEEHVLIAGAGIIALELDRIATLIEIATDPDRGIIDALRRIDTAIQMLEAK